MADQIPDFVDGDTSIGNRVTAAWLNDVNDATYRGAAIFTPAGAGAVATDVQSKERQIVSAFDVFTAAEKADILARTATLDVSVNFQKVIDAVSANGGGAILLPDGTYKCNIVGKSGVTLQSLNALYQDLPSNLFAVTFKQSVAGYVVDTPATLITGFHLKGVNLQGLGTATAGGGVRFRNVARGSLRSVYANNFANEGYLAVSPSIACVFEDVIAVNCVLNRARAVKIGAFDVDGTDHYLHRIESTISGSIEGTVQSASLFCVAVAIRQINGFHVDITGEISDEGFYVSGNFNRFVNCRGDLNYGHGWEITGSNNQFATSLALNNSQDTTNTYDGFRVTGVNNQFSVPQSEANLAKVHKYGINDLSSVGDANKNIYVGPVDLGAGTLGFNNAANAATWSFANGADKTLTANSATPSVSGYEKFITANSNPTTVTDFTGGVPGQSLLIRCNDANTTIQHNGATIITWNSGNVKLRSGIHYRLTRASTTWLLIGGDESAAPNVSADNGDAAKSLQFRIDESTQIWNTALTAPRAVTLSTTGAAAGAKFTIVRKAGATGVSALNVGTGPLKALAVSQWCTVEYDGAAWFLSTFGSL